MLPYLRLYDVSIYNYLRYEVLPLSYSERVEDELLKFDSSTNSYSIDFTVNPPPNSIGRGLVLFDEASVGSQTVVDTTSEQSTQIIVNGPSSYNIDYIRGRIINPDTAPTSVTYTWNYISVIQGWPGNDPPPLPIVALDIDTSAKKGYQLGGGSKDIIAGTVHVFATSGAEKKDITNEIEQSLFNRSLPIRNWHQVNYLNFDGTYTGVNPTIVGGLSSIIFTDVKADYDVGARLDWSELNRHRSKVNFVFEVLKDV